MATIDLVATNTCGDPGCFERAEQLWIDTRLLLYLYFDPALPLAVEIDDAQGNIYRLEAGQPSSSFSGRDGLDGPWAVGFTAETVQFQPDLPLKENHVVVDLHGRRFITGYDLTLRLQATLDAQQVARPDIGIIHGYTTPSGGFHQPPFPNEVPPGAIDAIGTARSAITVANFDRSTGARAWSSGRGPSRDPAYTGMKPDLAAPGDGIVAAALGGGTVLFGGTSAASPMVAGALALLMEEFGSLTVSQARDLLARGAIPVPVAGVVPNGDWGYGKLNVFNSSSVAPIPNSTVVEAGFAHTCAVLSDHTVRCWGKNNTGALGDNRASGDRSDKPVTVVDETGQPLIWAKSVGVSTDIWETGAAFSCALMMDETVRCWGSNAGGFLGTGQDFPVLGSAATARPVIGLSAVTSLSVGGWHTCAISAGDLVYCWGYDATGALGVPGIELSSTPVRVTGISGARAVASGGSHTCAILSDNSVRCWGRRGAGALGDGDLSPTFTATPVQVVGLTNAVAIGAGWNHSCAVRGDGTVWCWGDNSYGQLGNSTDVPLRGRSATPVRVDDVTNAVLVSASIGAGGEHSCALVADHSMRCWGSNLAGELGINDPAALMSPTPTTVPLSLNSSCTAIGTEWTELSYHGVTDIAVGAYYTCAASDADGSIWCWGNNAFGQLGIGRADVQSWPLPRSVVAIHV